jgi:ribosome-binding protein aMBF1 (putative translation factor)
MGIVVPKIVTRSRRSVVVELAPADWKRVERLLAAREDRADVRAYDAGKRRMMGRETVPGTVVHAILDGENAVRALRRWRGMTQLQLAAKARLSPLYVSQIETARRTGSPRVLRALAEALGVDVDLVVPRAVAAARASPRARR